MVQTDLYKQAVDKWGKEHQLYVTAEELGEAISAIMRFLNREDLVTTDMEEAMINEFADVAIMLGQIEVIYGDRFTQAIYKKLNKLSNHLSK